MYAIHRPCLNAIYAIYGQCVDKQRGPVVAHVPEAKALVVILVMTYTPTLWRQHKLVCVTTTYA